MGHRLDLATRTQISVCKSPFPSAGTAVSLFRAKTVQQRPLLLREVETKLLLGKLILKSVPYQTTKVHTQKEHKPHTYIKESLQYRKQKRENNFVMKRTMYITS